MMRSTGGEHLNVGDFEGLVCSTARMFASLVRKEEEDLRQELRIKVWSALESFDPRKCRTDVRRYVYGCIANKIKDFKRDAARRAKYGITVMHIEDMRVLDQGGRTTKQELFDSFYNFESCDEVFWRTEEDDFTIPSSVSEPEVNVLLMLMMGLTEARVALRLGMARAEVRVHIEGLRVKLADWRPTNPAGPHDSTVDTVRVEVELVGNRAA